MKDFAGMRTTLHPAKRQEAQNRKSKSKIGTGRPSGAEYDAARDEHRGYREQNWRTGKTPRNAEVVVEDEVDLEKINISRCARTWIWNINEELEYKIVGSTEANSLKGDLNEFRW